MKIKKGLLSTIFIALLAAVMIVLSCIFLSSLNKIIKVAVIFLFTFAFTLICLLDRKYKTALRVVTAITVFAAVTVSLYIVAELFGWVKYLEDFDAIKDFILSTKQWGMIVYFLLTVFQVVFLPIPSAVIILIGVAIYGPLLTFIISLIGTYIGSVICFWLGKSCGTRLINWMVGKDSADKYAKMLGEKGKWIFAIMMLFPFFPDDTLCLVAGSTSMKWRFFLLAVLIARPPMIAFTAFFGSGKIIPYSGWGIPVWIGIFVLCIVLIILAGKIKRKLLDKKYK